ncbi:hypothetical protein D9619_002116 [Psilocybe cf. subviscida]|uniref:BTB domain-containing protein n=1 Tax=Psilocybe cf. subviscida TaxID=2480587 RepID=A0A8H5BCZ5_9AGAR|nr:hypothetical protein D9619_002116 [Psilocybe cf. subviscida]
MFQKSHMYFKETVNHVIKDTEATQDARQDGTNNDELPSDVPLHVAAQMSLNDVTMKKLKNTVENNPAADLTVLLSVLNKIYPRKRKAATEKRPPLRRPRAEKDNSSKSVPLTSEHRPSMLDIYLPLEPEALQALSLDPTSPQHLIDAALSQLPTTLSQAEVLREVLSNKVVALNNDVVVKYRRTIEPGELHLMQYISSHCPVVKCPKPLGENSTLCLAFVKTEEKSSICTELDDMLTTMRRIPRPTSQNHPLGSVEPPYICQDTRTGYTRTGGPIYNEASFNDSFLLRDPLPRISKAYITWLRSYYLRDDHEIVMSHGDLNPFNIIVQRGAEGDIFISGIIDWEFGGWYPEYWDAVKALHTRGTDDESDWWLPVTGYFFHQHSHDIRRKWLSTEWSNLVRGSRIIHIFADAIAKIPPLKQHVIKMSHSSPESIMTFFLSLIVFNTQKYGIGIILPLLTNVKIWIAGTYQPPHLPPQFDSYWNFQSVIFQVERTLFSVWKKGFLVKGTPFETMFGLPTGGEKKVEGSSADNPIVLEGTSADDFRAFLRVLYPLGVPPVTEYSHWLGVLRLAHKWEFVEIRQQAVKALTRHISSKPAKEKISMGNQFLVPEWLMEGLVDIALDKKLEVEHLRQEPCAFDQESIIKFFYIQSKAWQKEDAKNHGYRGYDVRNFDLKTYITGRVEELFATELARAAYNQNEDA